MKIRVGFVSNSSSSSYIVYIPKEYVPQERQLKKVIDAINDELGYKKDTEEYVTEKMVKVALKELQTSKSGICTEGDHSEGTFMAVNNLMEVEKLVITTLEGAPDGLTEILNIALFDKNINKIKERSKI